MVIRSFSFPTIFCCLFSRFMSYFSVSTLPSFKAIIIIIIWPSLKLERNFSFFLNFILFYLSNWLDRWASECVLWPLAIKGKFEKRKWIIALDNEKARRGRENLIEQHILKINIFTTSIISVFLCVRDWDEDRDEIAMPMKEKTKIKIAPRYHLFRLSTAQKMA